MKNLIIILIVIVICAGLFLILSKPKPQKPEIPVQIFPVPPEGAIVFNMKYRGLSGRDDDIRYNSFWGFGNPKRNDSAFIKQVKKDAENIQTVYNDNFPGAEWSAVEITEGKAVTLYFDLNADGKLSDNEKISPAPTSENSGSYRHTDFVTPDLTIKKSDGTSCPFRALLRCYTYGDNPQLNFMWSPACVMEGKVDINGDETTLILYTNGFDGKFNRFGRSSYSLLKDQQLKDSYIPRQTLSSLINYNQQFYRMYIYGDNASGNAMRIDMIKDTNPTGAMSIQMAGDSTLNAAFTSARITGGSDSSISFNISSGQSNLPEGKYKLYSGYINYGKTDEHDWSVNFQNGPEFETDSEKECEIKLGQPKLIIKAVDQKDRYRTDVEKKTNFTKGTVIYLTPDVIGKEGEIFRRFLQKNSDSQRYEDKPPSIKIVDSDNKEIHSSTMEYG